jgi:inosine-uridine nucleoside N-ribohydrolase
MKQICRLLILISIIFFSSHAPAQVKVILDTDFGGDADDLGALAMLHHMMNQGECELLAIMSWSNETDVLPAIDGINRYYGNVVPLGIRNHEFHQEAWNYNNVLKENFPFKVDKHKVPLAVELYRQILANQPDKSVKLITVGPLKNILDLIESGPDQYSSLAGLELLQLKVNEMVVMGGKFPFGENEWNFNGNMPDVTRKVFSQVKVPVIFLGFEIGVKIKTGKNFNNLDHYHPLYLGYLHFSQYAPWMKQHFQGNILDNSSFDQTAVLYAVRGGIGRYWEKGNTGYCEIDSNGDNRWINGPGSNQSYLVLKEKPAEIAKLIELIMLHQE